MTENRSYDDHGVDSPFDAKNDPEVSPHHVAVTSRFAPKGIDPERAKMIRERLAKLRKSAAAATPQATEGLTFAGTGIGRENKPHLFAKESGVVSAGPSGGVFDYDTLASTGKETGNPVGRPKKDHESEEQAGIAQRRRVWKTFTQPASVRDYIWHLAEIWFIRDMSFLQIAAHATGQPASKSQVEALKKAITRAMKAAAPPVAAPAPADRPAPIRRREVPWTQISGKTSRK